MAKTKKEKDAEFAYQAMPAFVKYNNSLNIKTWITNFERKSDSYGLDHGWKVLHLSDYLQDEALTYYFESLCNIEDWSKLKESLIIRFQKVKLTPLVEMMRITQEEQETVTQYFHRKMQLINSVELNLTSIVELLNEGIKTKYKPYLATIDTVQPSEWLTMAIQVENSLTGSGTPVEKGRLQTLNPALHPALHPSPRPAGYYGNSQVQRPPMPCRICERLGLELQWHYHSVCPYRSPTASRSPATPRVQRPTASRSFSSASPHSYQAAASSSFPPPTPHDYQPTVPSASSPDSPRYCPLKNTTPKPINPDNIPIAQKPYRTSFYNNAEIQKQITELLKYGIIRPSSSPYSSPALLVNKKSDTPNHPTRLCIDYRKLNQKTVPEHTPIPLIEQIIDRLSQSKIYTILDVKNAYWHIPIDEKDKYKTSFVTQLGCYEWNRLPYGLKNGPSQFERIMKSIFTKHNIQYALNYFDDIIIHSKTYEEHITHLEDILNIFEQENIKLNLNKCKFLQKEIKFLGYTINSGKYTPNNTNIEAILKLSRPYNIKTLQRFLGTINIYNKFIPHYAQIRAPLNELLLKNAAWLWSTKHEQAFQTLKNALISKPVLYIYDRSNPCHLITDASGLGVAGVLKQPDEQGILHPIAYYSRKLHPYEQNYTASEIETLAIINSVQRFHTYLHNVHFTLHTDHLPLKWIKNVKNPHGRLFRWSLILSQYNFDIKHIKGLNNIEADMLSRAPVSFYLTYNELKEHQTTEQISNSKFKIQNDIFIINRKGFKRAYVPQTLRHKLLNKVHTKHGHIGTTKMTKIISPYYYWPHLTRDIANYTKHCETCQLNKSRDNRIVYGPLQQMPIATHPNHIFSLDTMGGLHNYGTTKHSIHMIVDHHSRFLWTFPTKSVSTDSYITCLKNLFQINKPEILITDRNAAFLSNKFKQFLGKNNVKHLLTSAHHPETNAKVERLNSTIINRLRCEYNHNLKIPWTKYIPNITESYNDTVHTITGFTPRFLYYGIQPQYIEHDTETHTPIEKARKLTIERTIKSHEHSKQLYDIKNPEPIFKEGDQINSTLSRMEGIKPPAEFVPYSNEKKWETWRESFEIFAIAVNLESMPLVRQRAILKHIAGEKTVMIYKTFHISENDTYPNVKEMLDMLTDHFKPFKNTIQRRNAFFTCVQKERQGIMEFVTELKHLAQECEFENLTESLIRDRLIIGILDREVKIKLLEDPQLTLPRAISIAVISESTCSQVASLNEQKMIEKIEKRNWVKDTIRMENAEAGPSGINPRRERIIEPCKWCGQRHKYGKCPAYGKKCNACGKTNHFSVVCRTKRIRNLLAESEAEESCDEINLNEVAVKTVRSDKWSAVIINNGKKTTVHLDTGAQINVLPHKVINQWPSRPEIRPTSLKAFAYGNTELPIVGKCNVLCQYGEKKGMFEFIVADVEAQTLITGDTCEKLEILRRINHINTDEMKLCSETQKILGQYHEVFQGVGLINSECKIYTKPEYSPVQVPPRRIPTSLGAEVQPELEKMVKQGIVTKIYHETEWSHPMTPAPAELLHEIPKAKYYTVLDVKSAYWHIPVAKECRDLLVMTTPFGKFRYNRLPFGLKISAQIFVEKMTNIFRDSFQNITYVDDLLIYADTIQEHNKKLIGILEKAKEKNIKFDLTKAQICLTKVRFLGHVISQNGIDPEPNKIDKLITFKRPEDKKSLQRIMGLYNFLGKLIPNLAASTSNIRGILRKNVVWHWGPKQDGEFDHIKECVRNAPSLAHFDKSKMLILQCDASKDAMGAALLQEDRPLAFASASFSDSQKQYSQIEKELLSVYYGCKKFEYLLSGHTFVVQTDHQPLLPLVKKPLSEISPRLQRLVMKLIAFDFKLQYKPGKYLIVADTLSRDTHPMDELPTPFLEDKRMVKMVRVNISDEKLVAMQKDTREDPALVKVIDYVIEGWPICKKDVDEDAKVFFDIRHRLYLWNDLLCIGSAIVIPKTQRNNMLNLLHQSHQGISAIQGLARESLFWPRMSIDIAEKVKNCEICQKHQKSKIRQPLKPFPVPDYPWQTVSLGIFYIQKKPHLLVVDRYSGYPEVFTLEPPTAINVKNKLRETFARFGIPETMMSDNGPPFRSEIMTDFCIRWGIKQLFSSPHLHRSNGLAERNIQTIKNQLIKCRDEGSYPYLAILAYRNTPKNDLPSPAQLCLSRSLRCQIPRITPLYRPYQTNWRSIENAKRKRQSSMKEQYDRNSKSYPKVNVGEDAWCQIHPRETWTPVKISAQADSPQSFEVVTPSGNRLIRNQQFIRPRDGGYEKSQLSSKPITDSPEAQHPQCDSPTMGESSTAPIQRSSEETNIDQREGATTSAGIAPEPSGRPRFSSYPEIAVYRGTRHRLEKKKMANYIQVAAPEGFNFGKPNEWPIWFKRFQRYRIASGPSEKSENEQVNALIYIMGDKAEEILILFNLSEAQIDDYKLVVSKFQDYFIGKRNVIYERAKFNRRSQGETEPVEEFITNLYVLAETCSYGILKEEMIRDRLVVGVKNFNLSEKLQLESELTLEKAIQIVRQSESVKNQQKKKIRQDTENRNVDVINRKGGRDGTIFQKTRMKGTKTYNSNFPKNPQGWSSNEKRKCFRCGYYQGHSKEQCPAKDAICNKCRKKGHFAKVCHTKTVQEVSSSRNYAFME
ncbi:K02A2.6-like [Cordylochernes scorpioides]|uniref:RNA-directed DNA polymerase n=1 Tax=Cordylochernes scorpioides TaxID=51811 RepID=A0ABY6JYI6_9ARAC|nr:K02A2.6-like [Cordylochernes scorpioides]